MMEDVKELLAWTKEAQEILKLAEETDFCELKKRDKDAILEAILNTDYEYEVDGDCDGTYLSYRINNVSIAFLGHGETAFPDDLLGHLTDMQLTAADEDVNVDELVKYLEQQICAGIKMINLTPHAVTFYTSDGDTVLQTVPSSGIARAEQERRPIGSANDIPVFKTSYGAVEGLPDPENGTIYIVSVITAQAAPNRDDLYITDSLVRDDEGRILGCRALAQI